MLFQELGKLKRTTIMFSIIMMTLGIVMILCPNSYTGALIDVLGYVALTTATVSQLQQTASLKEDIVSATATNNDLQIERSVLSSSSRIDRIATQNYGMVYPTSSDTITVGESADLDAALSTPVAADAAEEAADEDPEASADATQNAATADPRLMTS